jgi:hypothetical protein
MKGTLTATQKHKAGERLKASPMMFPFYQEGIINSTNAGAAERGDFLISFGPHLLGIHSFLFF